MAESSGLYWKITHDFTEVINDTDKDRAQRRADIGTRRFTCAVGTEGPGSPEADSSLPTPLRFILRDDDGNTLFMGEAANIDSCEYALDQWGRAYAGCTDLAIWDEPLWTWLSIFA